ncbi:hypothetical protein KsCSTR_01960 [Candidatus Kuenenia stuttgartiensis]|uniref:Uncharacterized protein n=1 Tax=Kuenenia stuttgartiensis TaxID=174633 RepID=Q1PUV1_KUEST|nr:hypothetical protein KsCSTR_01960 [Candidatus Kuenenia stuttgartiensis]CAJ71007.1 unknown protein [Candidatus Kuenenia stuttgartiensis]
MARIGALCECSVNLATFRDIAFHKEQGSMPNTLNSEEKRCNNTVIYFFNGNGWSPCTLSPNQGGSIPDFL